MKLINNTGTNRVIDVLRQTVQDGASLDIASPALSLFAFFELRNLLNRAGPSRIILPLDAGGDLTLSGSAVDRAARNRLQGRWLARAGSGLTVRMAFKFFFKLFDNLVPMPSLPLSLTRIEAKDIPAPQLSVAYDNFLCLEVLGNRLKPAGPYKYFFLDL